MNVAHPLQSLRAIGGTVDALLRLAPAPALGLSGRRYGMAKSLSSKSLKAPSGGRSSKPSRAEAEAAVRTLIQWAGDDPDREGLRATPSRVTRAFEEWFSGYNDDPREYLKR